METVEGVIGDRRWPPHGSDSIIRLVEALSDQAVYWVIERRYGEVVESLPVGGMPPRLRMRCDLYEALEFLTAAVAIGEPRLFDDYVQWRLDVLGSRSQQTEDLAAMLRLLQQFFEQRLGPMSGVPVIRVLAGGTAIANGGVTRPQRQPYVPAPLAYVDKLTTSLVGGDVGAARMLARRAQSEGFGYMRIATRLFQPALYAVGRLWQRNEITVAQEHLASAIAQTILTQIFVRDEFAPCKGQKALFACVAGNTHALGLRLVCDGFELDGWSVQFLGANVPAEALIMHVHNWRPQVLCLSAALVPQLLELRRLVGEIRETFGSDRPTIVVGGLATNEMDRIWEWIGADEWFPDAETASAGGS